MKKITTICKALTIKGIIILFVLLQMAGCASNKMSTIVGGDYDEDKDVTSYFVLPLGQVSIPGRWKKNRYDKVSRQQFFTNQDSIIIALAFGRFDSYEFNTKGALKGYDFIKAFYEWEAEYFESKGLERQLLESDSTKKYMVYRFYGQNYDTYFLIGERFGNVSNFSINATNKWPEKDKILFLKRLFLSSEKE